ARQGLTADSVGRMLAMRVGIVDVGSNTVRLLVAAQTGERLSALHERRAFMGLGEEIESYGWISDRKLCETASCVRELATAARERRPRDPRGGRRAPRQDRGPARGREGGRGGRGGAPPPAPAGGPRRGGAPRGPAGGARGRGAERGGGRAGWGGEHGLRPAAG